MESWARCQGDHSFSVPKEIVHPFNFLFDLFWNSRALYHSLDKRIWFAIIFFLSKKVSLCSLNGSFLLYLHVICPNWSFWGWTGSVTKINSTWFNRKLWSPHLSSLINSIVICSSQKGVVFENFIFVLDASSHSFKITGNIS